MLNFVKTIDNPPFEILYLCKPNKNVMKILFMCNKKVESMNDIAITLSDLFRQSLRLHGFNCNLIDFTPNSYELCFDGCRNLEVYVWRSAAKEVLKRVYNLLPSSRTSDIQHIAEHKFRFIYNGVVVLCDFTELHSIQFSDDVPF